MSWGNNTAQAVAPFSVEERDRRLAAWEEAKTVLEAAKNSEMEARKAVFEYCFPEAKEGTNRIELNNGFALKAVNKLNYTLKATNDQVDAVEEKASALGNEGTFLIERIITWKPNFSKSEYTKLDVSLPVHASVKKLVDEILEIKPGAPTLEIEAPKATLNG